MCEMKFFRIVDRGTEIYCAVFVLLPKTMHDRRLFEDNGWGQDPNMDYLFLMKLAGPNVEVQWDPYNWGGGRTMGVAHRYLIDLWREKGWEHLTTLDIVDVQKITGETK